MLSKSHRLPSGQKLDHSTSISHEYFRILIKPNKQTFNRFGFVVGKKVDKRAVVRNRLKRVLREAVKDFLETPKEYDVLFVVRKNFEHAPTQEIFSIVQTLLRKALNNETME